MKAELIITRWLLRMPEAECDLWRRDSLRAKWDHHDVPIGGVLIKVRPFDLRCPMRTYTYAQILNLAPAVRVRVYYEPEEKVFEHTKIWRTLYEKAIEEIDKNSVLKGFVVFDPINTKILWISKLAWDYLYEDSNN